MKERIYVSLALDEAKAVKDAIVRTILDKCDPLNSKEEKEFDLLASANTRIGEELRETLEENAKEEAEF